MKAYRDSHAHTELSKSNLTKQSLLIPNVVYVDSTSKT